MYTRNYVQEGGGIQLGKSDRKDAKAEEVRREVDGRRKTSASRWPRNSRTSIR